MIRTEEKKRRAELWHISKDTLIHYAVIHHMPHSSPQVKYQSPNKQDIINDIISWEKHNGKL